jgi:hypothetical protein
MRTTIDIPDETYRELKIKAAREGTAVRQIVLRALERDLEAGQTRPVRKLELPLIRSTRPGTLHLTNEDIDDILFSS